MDDLEKMADQVFTLLRGYVDKQIGALRTHLSDTDGGQYKLSAAIDGGRKFYLYPTTATTTKYWFGKAHFDISVNSTVSGAIEVSGAWAIAASLLDNGITA